MKKTASALSLSVYNRAQALARPRTANVNILQGVKGLEPVPMDEEGNPIEQEPEDQRIAEMKTDGGLKMMPRTGTEMYRHEGMVEC